MNDLEGLIGELEDAAARLRSGELDVAQASAIVEQLAVRAGEIGSALEREARTPAPGEPPEQETLL